MKLLLTLFSFLLILNAQEATVKSISDGDTIKVIFKGETNATSIRFAGVDTPETYLFSYKAKYDIEKCGNTKKIGNLAKEHLRSLITIGDTVDIIPNNEKSHDRTVAMVIKKDQNINLKMILDGYAVCWHGCSDLPASVADAAVSYQKSAINNKKGLWGTDFNQTQCLQKIHNKE